VLEKEQAERKTQATALAQSTALPPLAALLALRRGLREQEEILAFLGADEPCFTNPYDLPDMERAAERIERALATGEHITVFGDYDCDGVTATALLYTYLKERTRALSWHIPDRRAEGYGLTVSAIDQLAERGTQLIITVDNGVSALREIAHARALGIEVVVTDHHQVGDELPACAAVVNPHRSDCDLPFRDYAGVGVAFLLVCALEGCEPPELLATYGDLVALGTVADVVPLLDENRAFVRAGLALFDTSAQRLGLEALRRAARTEKRPMNATGLAFTLGPRINAAGRMDHAGTALELLLTDAPEMAERLAQRLQLLNEERQKTEQDIAEQTELWLAENPARRYDRVLVFAGSDWDEGVIGIVASRMTERFGRPCLMLSVNGETAKGSGRSLPGFSLFEAIHNSKALMIKYGGHALAAGFTLAAADVDRFRSEINAYAAQREMPFPLQALDARLNPSRLDVRLTDEIALLEPFGASNPAPVFLLRGLALRAVTPVSNGKHLRLTFDAEGTALTAMAFHTRRADFTFKPGDVLDLAVALERNEYMGKQEISLLLKNAKYSALPNEVLLHAQRLTEAALRGESIPPTCVPRRETAAKLYPLVKQAGAEGLTPEALFLALGTGFLQKAAAADYARLWLAAKVLCDCGILREDAAERWYPAQPSSRVAFEASPLLRRIAASAAEEQAETTEGCADGA
jgi:single-stranded-DNA-specific exonuclease